MRTVYESTLALVHAKQRPAEERRAAKRHDLEPQFIRVWRSSSSDREAPVLGQLIDLSSGGMRIRTSEALRADQQIRLRLELPVYAGISPFVDTSSGTAEPRTDWTGWMVVNRVRQVGPNEYEAAGRLPDMDELDRGMLALYLSTQPLAA